MPEIKIGSKVISDESEPFIIAEIGVNHENDIEKAKLMIRQAADAGADAVKFQTYKAETLASKYSPAYWDTSKESTPSQYALFKKYDKFGEDEYRELAKYAKSHGVYFLSTPFDEQAVDFLYDLVPAYKIASADITNMPFIKYIAKKGKPILLSTGASTIGEIEKAVNTIKSEGNNQIALLHCILNYPTPYENANLLMIRHLKNVFPQYVIGYSDHTIPDEAMLVLTTAYLLGARVIEKHFTFDKSLPGNDHYHSMDYHDLKRFVENIKLIRTILGKEYKEYIESEIPARKYARRSLVATRDIPEGTIIERDMITAKRPGTGISPEFLEIVIGKKAKRNIKEDQILTWDDIC
ncbi:MAG: N-acetylneuraminate synthase family protein [Candidatus Asgardarchaeia archaeon]